MRTRMPQGDQNKTSSPQVPTFLIGKIVMASLVAAWVLCQDGRQLECYLSSSTGIDNLLGLV